MIALLLFDEIMGYAFSHVGMGEKFSIINQTTMREILL